MAYLCEPIEELSMFDNFVERRETNPVFLFEINIYQNTETYTTIMLHSS